MTLVLRDEQFLAELATYIRVHPEQFVEGAALLDSSFSYQALRDRRARDVRRARGQYARELAGYIGVDETDHRVVNLKACFYADTDPFSFPYRRYGLPLEPKRAHAWKRHCYWQGIDPDHAPRPWKSPDDVVGAHALMPTRRLQQAIYAATGRSDRNSIRLRPDGGNAQAQAICLLGWLVYDAEACSYEHLRLEFKRIPWRACRIVTLPEDPRNWTVSNGSDGQVCLGRSDYSDELRANYFPLIPKVRSASSRIGVALSAPAGSVRLVATAEPIETSAEPAAAKAEEATESGVDEPLQPTDVFRLKDELWELEFEGLKATCKDHIGLHYIHELLAHPNESVEIAHLQSICTRRSSPSRRATEAQADDALLGGAVAADHGAPEVLDDEARGEYELRIQHLQQRREAATESEDAAEIDRIDRELEVVQRELSRSVGLHGRARKLGDAHEQMRKRVGNNIRTALNALARRHAPLHAHLKASIRRPTGGCPVYSPDPLREWRL